MAIAGHVSRQMLEHYSHIRLDLKRKALEGLATRRANLEGKPTDYDTNDDTMEPTRAIESKLGYRKELVGERGFEPPTPWSRTRCSTRLSHSPNLARIHAHEQKTPWQGPLRAHEPGLSVAEDRAAFPLSLDCLGEQWQSSF
jgi:hypothetical protein